MGSPESLAILSFTAAGVFALLQVIVHDVLYFRLLGRVLDGPAFLREAYLQADPGKLERRLETLIGLHRAGQALSGVILLFGGFMALRAIA